MLHTAQGIVSQVICTLVHLPTLWDELFNRNSYGLQTAQRDLSVITHAGMQMTSFLPSLFSHSTRLLLLLGEVPE